MKKLVLFLISLYQKTFSPDHGLIGHRLLGGSCRFRPTCSEYAYEAVEKHGVWRGLALSLGRILRCHPFAKGGFDPVPAPSVESRRHRSHGSRDKNPSLCSGTLSRPRRDKLFGR
jgi:hypothetical protein